MDNRRFSTKQALLLAVSIGLSWGLVITGFGVIYLAKSGNQPDDLQAILKVAAVEGLFIMVGTFYICRRYFWRRE
jgi:hypothetical protein